MKKGLLFAFAMVAVLLSFSSCDPTKTEDPTISVQIDSATYKTNQGIKGSIKITNGDLSKVELDSAGTIVKTYTTFTKAPISGSAGSYVVSFDSLKVGKYTLKATIKTGQYGSKAFEVKASTVIPSMPALVESGASVKIYCTLNDGSKTTTCASVDGTVYEPKSATTAQQALVDFVYFYKQMYSPSVASIDNVLKSAFTTWTTANNTIMVKSSTLNYTTSTYADVASVLATATASSTKVTDLKVGDVVAFVTSKAKMGMFKVNDITAGYTSTDYVNISIKVQK